MFYDVVYFFLKQGLPHYFYTSFLRFFNISILDHTLLKCFLIFTFIVVITTGPSILVILVNWLA